MKKKKRGKCKHKWSFWHTEMKPRGGTIYDPLMPLRGRMCKRCRKWQLQELRDGKWQ